MRRIPKPTGRFAPKPKPLQLTNTAEAIRQMIRHEVLRADISRLIVRKGLPDITARVDRAMGAYFAHRNSAESDAR